MLLEDEEVPASQGHRLPFPVVGLGASAGGLEAFRAFFTQMPARPGMAFVLVQHLDPTHKSVLGELLSRFTDMPVVIVEDRMKLEPNRVFLIPPDATLRVEEGVLRVEKPAPPRERRTPIDTFFCSLAEDQKENAVCIILSGTGSDGTLGLRAIKEEGGLTIAQEGGSAKYDGMPRSAVATGLVDHVADVERIPEILTNYLEHKNRLDGAKGPDGLREEAADHLQRICGVLRARVGHDFKDYKASTIIRRVQRRMQVRSLEDVPDYIESLRDDPKEAPTLLRDLLIGVTHFFRDREAFESLNEKVLKRIVADKKDGEAIRIWIPGCATGEEAYSIAILLSELLAERSVQPAVQIFGTDIDEEALQVARRGLFPETIAALMPEERLRRFFRSQTGGFQLNDDIRQWCIFSSHSLIKDPPFSKLDLLSCRNLLIYLKVEMQKRMIPIFHYALRPSGYLFLGPSESVGAHASLFQVVDRKWRIFRRRDNVRRPMLEFALTPEPGPGGASERRERATPDVRSRSLESIAERMVLDRHAPAFVVINEDREVIYAAGRASQFLEFPAGVPNLDVVNLCRPELRMDLRAVLHLARTSGGMSSRNHIRVVTGQGTELIRIVAEPVIERATEQSDPTRYYLVSFQESGFLPYEGRTQEEGADPHQTNLDVLESELRATKEYLQTTTEELESSNEELRSSNEELMSMNEELQSSNEELETSKEELQSVNEELETVNAELFNKVEELGRSNSDLQNLLESTQIATVFLDRELRIKSFTPMAKQIFNFIERDHGRSLADITARLAGVDVAADARQVLEDLKTLEREVELSDGVGTFVMHVLPYRTLANVIDGVVLTFVDVTRQKQAQGEAELRARQQDAIATLGAEGLRGMPSEQLIQRATTLMLEVLETDLVEAFLVEGSPVALRRVARAGAAPDGPERFDPGEAPRSLEALLLQEGGNIETADLAKERRFDAGDRLLESGFRSCWGTIVGEAREPAGLLIGYDRQYRSIGNDGTRFVEGVATVLANRIRLGGAAQRQERLVAELQHRVKNTLAVVQAIAVHSFGAEDGSSRKVDDFTKRLHALARTHVLLNRTGWEGVGLRDLLIELGEPFAHGQGQWIDLQPSPRIVLPPNAALNLAMAVHEMVTNAAKHGALSTEDGRIEVGWSIDRDADPQYLTLVWRERGGPTIAEPTHRGFGTEIIESGLRHALEAVVTQEFAPDGLRCTIRFPVPRECHTEDGAERAATTPLL